MQRCTRRRATTTTTATGLRETALGGKEAGVQQFEKKIQVQQYFRSALRCSDRKEKLLRSIKESTHQMKCRANGKKKKKKKKTSIFFCLLGWSFWASFSFLFSFSFSFRIKIEIAGRRRRKGAKKTKLCLVLRSLFLNMLQTNIPCNWPGAGCLVVRVVYVYVYFMKLIEIEIE